MMVVFGLFVSSTMYCWLLLVLMTLGYNTADVNQTSLFNPLDSNSKSERLQRSTKVCQWVTNVETFPDPGKNCQQGLMEFAIEVYRDIKVKGVISVRDAASSGVHLPYGVTMVTDYVFENCSWTFDILGEIFNDLYQGREELNVLIVLGDTRDVDLRLMKCFVQATEHVVQIKTRWMVVSTHLEILDTLLEIQEFENLPNLSVVARSTDDCIPRIFTKVEHPHQTVFDEVSNAELTLDKVFPNFKYKMNGRHLNVSTVSASNPLHLPTQLLDIISWYVNFTYSITVPSDMTYGALVNGSWSGLVGQLVNKEASLVFALLTENLERHQVVDFIYPPIDIAKTGIIFKKEKEDSSWLLFWRPFGSKVYLCIAISYVCISLLLLLSTTGLFVKRAPVWNTVLDILLFTAGCLFLEGGNVRFKHTSRMLLWASWWLFCVVMGGLYTAMLTKVFIPKDTKLFNGVSQLLERTDWKYGTVGQSYHTDQLIYSSNHQTHNLWTNIMSFRQSDPNILSPNLDIQIRQILAGKYAFISSAGERYLSFLDNCDLDFVIFPEFSESKHSLAVPKGSVLKHDMEDAMRRLKYSGIWDHLTYKGDLSRKCNMFDNSVKPLLLDQVKGMLIPFVIGISTAIFVLLLEKLYAFCSVSIRHRQ